jgi:hypothetical protein
VSSDTDNTRLQYLEKVVNHVILPHIMSTNKNKQTPPPAGTPPADGTPPATDVNATPQGWALNSPRFKVPTPEGLIVVTAEVLNGDPDLLARMVREFPECFSQLPAPPETTEE